MSPEDHDPTKLSELDAGDLEVESRLRAAFASRRPRPGFSSELQGRLHRPSWWARVRAGWEGAPGATPRGLPGWRQLAPALALLVVVAGVVAVLNNVHPPGGATTSSAPAMDRGATKFSNPAAQFGKLPAPGNAPGAGAAPVLGVRPSPGANGGVENPAGQGGPEPPAAGGEPRFPITALVFRYGPAGAPALAGVRSRSRLPLMLVVADSGEPGYAASLAEPVGAAEPFAAAEEFLARHGLLPAYTSILKRGIDGVVYNRVFTLEDGTAVPEVSALGAPAGTRITIIGGNVTAVSGPLELPLEQSSYPLRTAAAARGSVPGGSGMTPALVYVAVADPDGLHGYFEPAYLFRGGSGAVIVPAVAATSLK